jgi:2-hydroxy-6-oxonona-2,4-dienedioate hydrolase
MAKTTLLPRVPSAGTEPNVQGVFPSKPWRRTIGRAMLAAVVIGSTLVYVVARRDIQAAHRWMDTTGSQVATTRYGPMEYTVRGEGQTVLLIHGTSGGIMQGLLLAERLGNGFRFIIPARFGYFGTPLPADAAPAAQAEAYIDLLDVLGEQQVAVWAVSAGALSALELAATHPDRVSRLVLMSPAAWSPDMASNTQPVAPVIANLIKNVILKSDMALWLMSKVARPTLMGFLGVPPSVEERMTRDERELTDQIVRTLLTVSRQQEGLLNEARNHEQRQRAALEQITAPTLILTAADDPFVTLPGAEYTAAHIPQAQLIRLPQGGHQLVGGLESLWAEEAQFLRTPAGVSP